MEAARDRLLLALAALMRWFDERGLQAAIIGGVGASLRGKPRLTKDIDAVVLDVDAETLLTTASEFDIKPRVADAIDFARRTRVLLMRHSPSAVDLDLSLGMLPFEQEVVDRASLIEVGDVSLRVASAEDLVIMKAVAGRARDLADIEGLISTNPDLDVERIRRWVREFSSVLEMPEMYEKLEEMLRARHRH